MSSGRPLVGVIGGVGPLATAYFLTKVIKLTKADRDQDHVDLLVFNHANIPDRTDFILGRSAADPGPVMAEDARRLEQFGVSLIVVPCNTAHFFTDQIVAATRVPVLSIVAETVVEARSRAAVLHTAGLLATTGTVVSGVYQRALEEHGIETLVPDDGDQARLMEIIYDQVKAGATVDVAGLLALVDGLCSRGAQVVLLGCTELSVVADDFDLLADPLLVDSLEVLARRTIASAGCLVRG
jgi:aspartate racemase